MTVQLAGTLFLPFLVRRIHSSKRNNRWAHLIDFQPYSDSWTGIKKDDLGSSYLMVLENDGTMP